MSKQINVTFDDGSFAALEKMAETTGSKSSALRNSLELNYSVLEQASEGFSQVVLRNPRTKEERVLVIPALRGK